MNHNYHVLTTQHGKPLLIGTKDFTRNRLQSFGLYHGNTRPVEIRDWINFPIIARSIALFIKENKNGGAA